MEITDVPVRGMTCRACEVRVGKALRAVPGVRRVEVSATRGRARVEATARIPHSRLVAAVERAGYVVGDDDRSWVSRDRRVWTDVTIALAAVVLLAVVARATGLTEQLGSLGSSLSGGGLVTVLLLGVTAGVSTCMALVGGLVLAVSARHAEAHPGADLRTRLRPHLVFNLGRVVGFGLGGAALGALGSVVRLNGALLAVLAVGVSLVMVTLGLQLTKVSPRLATARFALPAGIATRLRLDDAGSARYTPLRAGLLGAATFVLPCGFTQAVQLLAVSTADPAQAALVMALFAVGTTPGLLAVGGATAAVRGSAAPRLFRFAGVAVLAFAVVNLSGALTVLAPGLLDSSPPAAAQVSSNVTVEEGVQVLRTVQDVGGYEPAAAVVEAGTPVRWEIDSVSAGCASALVAPHVQASTVLLEPGVNVLEFTPTEPGRLHYTCAMGMYRGVIDVIAADGTDPAEPGA